MHEYLLNEKKWEILKNISIKPMSPMQIAKSIGTTISYVSQQLKLLEVAGLVNKSRTGLSERGKPRNIYDISKEFIYVNLLEYGFACKRQVKVNAHRKALINIWALKDESLQDSLETFYSKIREDLKYISGIFVIQAEPAKIIINSDSSKVQKKIHKIISELSVHIDYSFLSEDMSEVGLEEVIPIYDPKNLFKKRRGILANFTK